MKLKVGDKISVIAGRDKGMSGNVETVYKKTNKVLVMGVCVYKKHIKKSEKMPKGGIVDLPRPIDVSKIMFVCPKCNKNSRIGMKVEKNKKSRFCKSCKEII